jgi:hypothetical protein
VPDGPRPREEHQGGQRGGGERALDQPDRRARERIGLRALLRGAAEREQESEADRHEDREPDGDPASVLGQEGFETAQVAPDPFLRRPTDRTSGRGDAPDRPLGDAEEPPLRSAAPFRHFDAAGLERAADPGNAVELRQRLIAPVLDLGPKRLDRRRDLGNAELDRRRRRLLNRFRQSRGPAALRVAEASELRVERPRSRRQRELQFRRRRLEIPQVQIQFLELDELDFLGLRERRPLEEAGEPALGPSDAGVHVLELGAGRKPGRHLPAERLEALRFRRDVRKGNGRRGSRARRDRRRRPGG